MCNEKPDVIKIGFLDDDRFALDIIQGSITKIFHEKNEKTDVRLYSDASLLLEEDCEFDIFFCDIEIPSTDGILVAEQYKKKHPLTEIIFVSNREDRVFDSLTVHPFGFIRKKNFIADIQNIISAYIEKRNKEEGKPYILVSIGTGYRKILLDDIIFIETFKRNQFLHLVQEKEPLEVNYTMKKLCDDLECQGFIVTHKSYLVNYKHIKEIQNESILMSDGSSAFLSRRKTKEVKEKYLELLKTNNSFLIL